MEGIHESELLQSGSEYNLGTPSHLGDSADVIRRRRYS